MKICYKNARHIKFSTLLVGEKNDGEHQIFLATFGLKPVAEQVLFT
jgi:hypothetical protein